MRKFMGLMMLAAQLGGLLVVNAGAAEPVAEEAAVTPVVGRTSGSRLTLAQFSQVVLANNTTIAAQKLGVEASLEYLQREQWVYEPDLVASGGRARTERENTVEQAINQGYRNLFLEDRDTAKLGVEGLLPTGARYRIGGSIDDIRNNLSATANNPQYQAFAGVSLTQPLLKNGGVAATMVKIRLAKVESEVTQQQYRRTLMELMARAEAAYWDAVQAQKEYGISRESVAVAEKVLADNRARVTAGKMSDLEVAQAESGLAMRQSQANDVRQKLQTALAQLRTYMSESAADAGEADALEVTDEPQVQPLTTDFNSGMAQALKVHPDYLRQLKLIEQEDIRVSYADNQCWPQLDLVASYGYNGLGSDSGNAWRQVQDNEYEAWSVGLEFRVPLGGGHSAKHDRAAARLKKKQALLELKSVEVEIANALRSILGRARSSAEQVGSFTKVADFNRRLLEVELAKLEAGKSDSRKVLEVETDLFKARSAELQSVVDNKKAFIELELVQGTMLSSRKIEVLAP